MNLKLSAYLQSKLSQPSLSGRSLRRATHRVTALLLMLGACQRTGPLNANSSIATSGSTASALHPEAPNARTLLWRVERNNHQSYLFGTMHVAVSMRDGLGPEGEAALARSQVVCVEASVDDTGAIRASLFHAVVRAQLPEGESLHAILGDADWPKVTSMMPAFPPAAIDRFDPSIAALFVVGVMQNREAPTAGDTDAGASDASVGPAQPARAPMDQQIAQFARSRGLRVMPLESVDDQLEAFRALTRDESLALIRSVVRDPRDAARRIQALQTSYRGTDAETEIEGVVATMHQHSTGFARVLLDLRNEHWMPTLDTVMGAGGAFVAVGAAHTVGSKGLVALLRRRGFTVTRVHVGE